MLFASAFFLKEITALLEANFWYKLTFLEIQIRFCVRLLFYRLKLESRVLKII